MMMMSVEDEEPLQGTQTGNLDVMMLGLQGEAVIRAKRAVSRVVGGEDNSGLNSPMPVVVPENEVEDIVSPVLSIAPASSSSNATDAVVENEGEDALMVAQRVLTATRRFRQRVPKVVEPIFIPWTGLWSCLAVAETDVCTWKAVAWLSAKYRIPPIAWVASASIGGVAWLYRLFSRHPKWFSSVTCVAYPVYASLKAIERPELDDDERWLTYWSLFGMLSVFEEISPKTGRFYYSIKLAFFYWLSQHGGLTVYRRVVRQLFLTWQQVSQAKGSTFPLRLRHFLLSKVSLLKGGKGVSSE